MAEDYIGVEDAARELGLGQATVWLLLKRRPELTRYRIPGRGKRTFIRRTDPPRLREPVPVARGRAG